MKLFTLEDNMIYIAGPFFNPQQITVINNIRFVIEDLCIEYFSPKDECMYTPGVTTPEEVLNTNMDALNCTSLLVCVTDGKDPGTMFEAGWSYAKNIPIIYVWLTGAKGQKFNLMLGASGSVVQNMGQLKAALADFKENGFTRKHWGEEIEYE
jgi:nucleoside 2-deoxyribosyltransferase